MIKLPDDDELGAYLALAEAGELMQRAVAAQLEEHALSTPQFSILASLFRHDGALRMRDLADRVVISRSGLTYQVTQLEAEGLVSRSNALDDERGIEVHLTDAGRRRVSEAFPGHVELVRRVFLDVVDPESLAVLRRSLEEVAGELREQARSRRRVGVARG